MSVHLRAFHSAATDVYAVSMTPLRAWPLLVALAACITENPAFKPTSASTSGTGGPDVTSGGPDPTTAAPTGDTGGDGTTTAVSAAGSSDTTATTTDPTTDPTADPTATTGGPVCTVNPTDPPCTMLNLNGHNYLRCDAELTWEMALVSCSARCGSLVMFTESTPDADQESLDVMNQLRMLMDVMDKQLEEEILDEEVEQEDVPRASWWIGGYRHSDDNTFYWLDDSPMPAMGMGGWNPADPDPGPDSDQDCAALAVYGYEAENGKWFDRRCDQTYRYLCELP